MKIFIIILSGLGLVVLSDLFFEYLVSGDFVPIPLIVLGGLLILFAWIFYFTQIYKHLKNKT